MLSPVQSRLAPKTSWPARSKGFGLVEIMVGLVIGLLATMVIMQIVSVFEERKRTITGGADAQTNGSMALYGIKRDIEMAGYGTPVFSSTNSPLTCTNLPEFDHDANSATPDINLFPIVITDGGTGSDRIAIRYGRTESGGIPIKVTVALGTNAMVVNNMGCQAGNWAVISAGGTMSAGGNCAVVKVKDSLAPLATRSNWTQIELESIPTQLSGSIACLGSYKKDPPYDGNSSPLEYLYWVDNGVLVQGGNPATSGSGTPVGEGIVNIQAQYGVSAIANSNQITQWVNASGATWATPSMANRNRIKAIRLAIVARDGMLEKTDVTNACSSTTAANPTGLCAWDATSASPSIASPAPAINLTTDPDWQRYRYRVFETIIPLRNMIWSKATFKP